MASAGATAMGGVVAVMSVMGTIWQMRTMSHLKGVVLQFYDWLGLDALHQALRFAIAMDVSHAIPCWCGPKRYYRRISRTGSPRQILIRLLSLGKNDDLVSEAVVARCVQTSSCAASKPEHEQHGLVAHVAQF